ncbi:hypothetical protein DICSQDRAFT_159443 [Dichomitus squalens LYAD-421 SS1]|uniref:uncharacterized protein n=1 Tax=Dichomitus squalens (strain LYAD-421) TaxID=732165 RepID=UPI0004413F2B|nr:uncharacterized protein DICSQDRAFT_159443 [Dichomitus squalens LYAD-421 SS1]EJF65257.1 hypothetical protein DICSQDRAFT_159443 [Dichomitus squalens LYAD-421 SS1]
MRITRSATRMSTAVDANGTKVPVEETVTVVPKTNGKRAANTELHEPPKRARATNPSSNTPAEEEETTAPVPRAPTIPITPKPAADGEELVPAVLTFSFEVAKNHLISVDPRFEEMFKRVSCKPFEHLERVDPFRGARMQNPGSEIVTSIGRVVAEPSKTRMSGAQEGRENLRVNIRGVTFSPIFSTQLPPRNAGTVPALHCAKMHRDKVASARAITHKFVRLFDPSIPEDVSESQYVSPRASRSDFFPSAHQVIAKDVATLRTAGLSGRKAEYVLDLAGKFADGTLSTRKLLEADDEELHKMLTAVRGIGTWTVDMFAMFSLRRPDILPVGDLGVQRGMLRWFISLHSPSHAVFIRQDKLNDQDTTDTQLTADSGTSQEISQSQNEVRATTAHASALPAAPDALSPSVQNKKGKGKAAKEAAVEADTGMVLPPAFTPSINKTLNMLGNPDEVGIGFEVPPLPEGLTVAQMKTRLTGKNKIKGALLTPMEMEALAESWRPYRSLGVYYMWALSEEPK